MPTTIAEKIEFKFPCPFHSSCRRAQKVFEQSGKQMRALVFKKEGETEYAWKAFSDFCDNDKYISRERIIRALNDYIEQVPERILDFVRYLKQEPTAVSF